MGTEAAGNKMGKVTAKILGEGVKQLTLMEKISGRIEKHFQNVLKIYKQMGLIDDTSGGGLLGMGKFTRTEKVVGGGLLAGATMYSMMPSTSAAVSQRLAANTMVGLTGMGPNQFIRYANKGLGLGATSVGAPTQTAMALMYQGGMSVANPYIYNNIFKQVGGLSAMSGMSNQQVAQALSQVNSMNFLRTGTMVRDSRGNLAAPNQMINRLYTSMYGGRDITREQAALTNNPYTASYRTIAQVSGGNQELQALLTAGIQFRAIAGRDLTAKDMRNPEKVFKMLGLDPKNDPMAANLRNIFAKNKLLEESQQGLVSGYTKSLDANASLTNGFTQLAEVLGPVYDGLANLKGILETFPAAGSVGGTLSGIGSNALGLAAGMYMMRGAPGGLLTMGKGGAASAAAKTGGTAVKAGVSGILSRAGGFLKGTAFKGVGKALPGIGAAISGFSGYKDQESRKGFLKGLGSAITGGAVAGGVVGGVTTGGVGIVPGAIAGGLISGIGYGLGYGLNALTGGDSDPIGGDSDAVSQTKMSGKDLTLQLPVPKGSPISSHYGPRKQAAERAKKDGRNISSYHRGTDFAVPVGTPVKAAADGVVTEMGRHKDYGDYVIIKHGSKSTLYAHLSRFATRRGAKVKGGDLIAYSGGAKGAPGAGNSGGPHLHFELRDNGSVGAQGRVNPENFFGKSFQFLKNIAVKGINFVKQVSNKLFGTNLSWNNVNKGEQAWDFSESKELSTYNSPGLASLIASLIGAGGAIGYSDLEGVSGKFKSSITVDGKKQKVTGNINDKDNLVSGDKVGMVGGNRPGLIKFLHRIGFKGKALETAFAVALAESGGRATARNATKDYGLFQINMLGDLKKERLEKDWKDPITKKPFNISSSKDLLNPNINAKIAYHMSGGGKDWSSWVAYTSGSFVKYLDDASRAAKKAKIPTYHEGIDRVPQEQLALLDKDEMVIPPNLANQIRNKTVPAGGTTNINVKMDVNIARASIQEVEFMFTQFKHKLENELKNNRLGSY